MRIGLSRGGRKTALEGEVSSRGIFLMPLYAFCPDVEF